MKKTTFRNLFIALSFIVILLPIYPSIQSYFSKRCITEKYGVDYNEQRKKLGLYILPASWGRRNLDSCIIWYNPSGHVGHRWKNIAFKGCNIQNELDLFAFGYDAEKKLYTKVLEVEAIYDVQAKVVDIRYKVQTASSSRPTTKAEADSLIRTLGNVDPK
ncbi:MAG: hypothetical protein LBV59_10200 [Sphingobacterium sp.]|jgi:hypothetical protein|uniref:hypothetical protein n=1 Tax=unclassified Sphingobacterium TaxID=2609468 RepID=UPI00284681B6|nr:hypothetical protein [Sphingobacterium sp.]MDR3008295.1 hypothetical protein [Sphingobacterium sp.]